MMPRDWATVVFVGVGESADDLEPFLPEAFLQTLLDGAFVTT